MNNYKHTNLTTNQALNKLKQNGKNQLIKAKKKKCFCPFSFSTSKSDDCCTYSISHFFIYY